MGDNHKTKSTEALSDTPQSSAMEDRSPALCPLPPAYPPPG